MEAAAKIKQESNLPLIENRRSSSVLESPGSSGLVQGLLVALCLVLPSFTQNQLEVGEHHEG